MSHYSTGFRCLAALLLFFFCTQAFLSESCLASFSSQQISDLQKAKDAFTRGEYATVIEIVNHMITDPVITDEEKIEALAILASAYFNLGQKNNARDTYRKILEINLNYEPNPIYISPDKIAFFQTVKTESIAVLVLATVPSNLTVIIDDHPQEAKTPNRYSLLDGKHQIMVISPDTKKYITWKDYKLLEGGKDNPVTIELEKILPKSKPIYKRFWFWGVVVVVAGIGYFIFKKDKIEDKLPEPPAHP